MSKHSRPDADAEQRQNPEIHQGPNLVLLYSLLGLALLAAVVIAGLIVLPFYHRR